MNIELNLQLMLQLFTLSSFVSQRTVWRLALEALDLHKSPVGYMYRGGGRGGGRAWLFGRKSDFGSFPVRSQSEPKNCFAAARNAFFLSARPYSHGLPMSSPWEGRARPKPQPKEPTKQRSRSDRSSTESDRSFQSDASPVSTMAQMEDWLPRKSVHGSPRGMALASPNAASHASRQRAVEYAACLPQRQLNLRFDPGCAHSLPVSTFASEDEAYEIKSMPPTMANIPTPEPPSPSQQQPGAAVPQSFVSSAREDAEVMLRAAREFEACMKAARDHAQEAAMHASVAMQLRSSASEPSLRGARRPTLEVTVEAPVETEAATLAYEAPPATAPRPASEVSLRVSPRASPRTTPTTNAAAAQVMQELSLKLQQAKQAEAAATAAMDAARASELKAITERLTAVHSAQHSATPAAAAMQAIQVKVPAGVAPGGTFLVMLPNGSQMQVTAPPGAMPGQTLIGTTTPRRAATAVAASPASPRPSPAMLPANMLQSPNMARGSGKVRPPPSPPRQRPAVNTWPAAHPMRLAHAYHYKCQPKAAYRSSSDRFGHFLEHAMLGATQAENPGTDRLNGERLTIAPGSYAPQCTSRGDQHTVAAAAIAMWNLPCLM